MSRNLHLSWRKVGSAAPPHSHDVCLTQTRSPGWTLCSKSSIDPQTGKKTKVYTPTICSRLTQQGPYDIWELRTTSVDVDVEFASGERECRRFVIYHAIHLDAQFRIGPNRRSATISRQLSSWLARREERISKL